jgi:hypothetical protein
VLTLLIDHIKFRYYSCEEAVLQAYNRWNWCLEEQVRLAMDAKEAADMQAQQVHERDQAEAQERLKTAYPLGGMSFVYCLLVYQLIFRSHGQ